MVSVVLSAIRSRSLNFLPFGSSNSAPPLPPPPSPPHPPTGSAHLPPPRDDHSSTASARQQRASRATSRTVTIRGHTGRPVRILVGKSKSSGQIVLGPRTVRLKRGRGRVVMPPQFSRSQADIDRASSVGDEHYSRAPVTTNRWIPSEVLCVIMNHLTVPEVCAAKRVSRQWTNAASDAFRMVKETSLVQLRDPRRLSKAMGVLCQRSEALTRLHVNIKHEYNIKDLSAVLNKCSKLEAVTSEPCLPSGTLAHVTRPLANLRVLHQSVCSPDDLSGILSWCTNLRTLHLHLPGKRRAAVMVAPHLLAAIMNFKKLEFLLLEGFTLRPQLLRHLGHLTKLESLVLLQSRISDLECAAIAAYVSPRLRNLSLRGSKVTTEGIAMLAGRLTRVEELDIVKTYVCIDFNSLLSRLDVFPRLRVLYTHHPQMQTESKRVLLDRYERTHSIAGTRETTARDPPPRVEYSSINSVWDHWCNVLGLDRPASILEPPLTL